MVKNGGQGNGTSERALARGAAVFLHCSALLFFRQSCADYWRTGICNFGCNGTGDLLRSRGNRLEREQSGIKFTSKVILQAAVVLLGFGMNLGSVLETGKRIAADYSEYNFYLADCGLCFTEVFESLA